MNAPPWTKSGYPGAMASSKARLALVFSTFSALGLSALWACEDNSGGDAAPLQLDGAPSGHDASLQDAPAVAPPDAATTTDAAPDAPAHVDPLRGIWRGVGDQGGSTWTILLDLVDGEPKGPPGTVVGVMTYPSLACGGTLVVSDAGPPDSGTLDGGGGVSLTLHESVSSRCIEEGEDTFTLMPDGGLFFEYRTIPNGPVDAFGSLARVDEVGSASPAFRGIWRSGELNQNNLRPVLVSISRDDKVGAAAGAFLIARADGVSGCGGHWTLAGKTGTSLTLTEVFNDEQTDCIGPGSATLEAVAAALEYTRTVDGGTDTDAGDGGFTLTPF